MHEPRTPRPQRVAVVGTSGSGKSTFAAALADRIDADHIELDAHFHLPGWQQRPFVEFRARIDEATSTERWVADGNYSAVRDLIWQRADTIVWLDYSRRVTTTRVLRRTLRRGRRSQLLWGMVYEDTRRILHPNPDKNIVLWSMTTHAQNRRLYTELKNTDPWRAKRWLRFENPPAADRYLALLE